MNFNFFKFFSAMLAVTTRQLRNLVRNPVFLLPSLLFPLLFFISFAGGLSNLDRLPNFNFKAGYTAFQFIFVFFQISAFGGFFAGLSIAGDFEHGFARRMMMIMEYHTSLIAGYILASIIRSFVMCTLIFALALATGMNIDANLWQILLLYSIGVVVTLISTLWAAGVALRLRTVQAAPLMQLPLFLVLFLAPVFVPRNLLSGWIRSVANYNPMTAFLEVGRNLISGQTDHLLLAYAVAFVMFWVFSFWALGGLRSAEHATN